MLIKTISKIMLVLLLFPIMAGVYSFCPFASRSLTPSETTVISLVNGTEAYSYGKQIESIGLSHYGFRAAGSKGANETADWITRRFESFGLEALKEEFQFNNWDLLSKPLLVIDEDGTLATTHDQNTIESFQSAHYSLPVNAFADLVVLPLPPAANRDEIGSIPIGSSWETLETTGKVVLVGREIRFDDGWQETFSNKLRAEPPATVLYTWWYEWMSFVPDFFSSAGGRPVTPFGPYYWDLGIGVGFVAYDDGLWIRSKETNVDVSARIMIDSVVDVGPHYNVVGELTGYREPDKYVLISAHYDTVTCAGFCDNGAGTAGLIELSHVFTDAVKGSLYYPDFTLLFVALAGEEIGLVGSINYIAQHKADMEDILAVINLDSIGSEILEVTATEPDNEIDLDQVILDAAGDLGISARLIERDHSDETVFLYPPSGDYILTYWWDKILDIGDAHPIGSTSMLSSSPLFYGDLWSSGTPGWIHTSNDKSTTTNWVEPQDLADHIKVAALTVMRVSPSFHSFELPALWIGLALLITVVAAAVSIVYIKHRKKYSHNDMCACRRNILDL